MIISGVLDVSLNCFESKGFVEILKVKIGVEAELKLVRAVVSEGIDDKLILMRLIKCEGCVELLELRIWDDTGGHWLIKIYKSNPKMDYEMIKVER